MKTTFFCWLMLVLTTGAGVAQTVATEAINAVGIDLLHRTATPRANALLSPYSIQVAMAMACAGAAGQTREEMARVLHYPKDENQVDQSLAALQAELNGIMQRRAAEVADMKQYGVTNDPLTLTTANRVFGQVGYGFRPAYLALLKDTYNSPLEPLDFLRNAPGATVHINDWVATQTRERIQNLIPAGALDQRTRLVLVNAIYLKAPWQTPFPAEDTRPARFYLAARTVVQVPTMSLTDSLGYAHRDGCQIVVLPYQGGEIQFVIILPDALDGLAAVEAALKPGMLADCANLPAPLVRMYLPKFKLKPPTIALSEAFQSLGMKSAFDVPRGSANFDRMAPRRPEDYLFISAIFHKTFLKLDEKGTEAAAATAVGVQATGISVEAPKPVEVHVDHPFVFAIQHRASGACLFLGHVVDPR